MTQNYNIIQKIKKLLALAGDPANEHQAAAAAEKAQQLCFQHNLSLKQVDLAGTDPLKGYDYTTLVFPASSMRWRRILMNAIARNNFCEAVQISDTNTTVLIGKTTNREIVQYLYHYLATTLERLSKESYREAKERSISTIWPQSYCQKFCTAAITVLHRRLQRQRQEDEDAVNRSAGALILQAKQDLDSAVKKLFSQYKLTTHKPPKIKQDWASFQGWKAGQTIPLNKGIEQQ